MIFKTISDKTTLSGQKIVSILQARKIAQEEVNLSIQKHIAKLELDKAALTQLEQKIASGISYEEAYAQSMNKASAAAKEHAIQTRGLAGTTDTFVAKQKIVQTELESTAASSRFASAGVKALSTAFNMFAGMTIMWGITKIIEGFKYLSDSAERAKEKLEEIQTELSDNNSTYQSNRSTLVGLKDEYDTLTKKAESLGGAQNLTNDEYERYKEITSQILGITPKLTTGWNDEGEAISNKNNLLQASIDLLDEEYEKSLRNNTTKSKNEDVASGVIAKIDEFNNSADTTTRSGTTYDMYTEFLEALRSVDANNKDLSDYDIAEQIYNYLYPDGKGLKSPGVYSDWFDSLWKEINKLEDWDKLANSFIDENNPIYELFSDEVIDNMIKNADEYFLEGQRILEERETLYQDYKDQLNWNAQATQDKNGNNAYNQLTDNGKAFVNEYIEGLDYASIKTEEDFVEMANDIQKFTKLLASNDNISKLVEDIFTHATENETSAQYIKRVQTAISGIQKYCEDNYIDFPINFTTLDDVNRMTNGVQALLSDEFDDKVVELSLEDLKIASNLEVADNTILSWEELIECIREAKNEVSDSTTSTSFLSILNSADYAEVKEELLSLAKSGEITADVLESTEEYADLLSQTGLSAESAKQEILNLLSVQEKLSAASNGLDSLKSAYEEFKNEDIGFVTAKTLESLPDAFKKLDGFDVFSQIVGDPTSGAKKIQQAFNDITKQYLISQGTFDGLIHASSNEINSYIANLKQMGITNAEEIVNLAINVLSQENQLINEATYEYYEAYVNYISGKEKVDLEYLKSSASKSGQLASALGGQYKTDYQNWCNLLESKAKAYNEFIKQLGNSYNSISVPNAPYSEEGLTEAKAKAIIENANKYGTASNPLNSSFSIFNSALQNKNAKYTKDDVEAAQNYLNAVKQAKSIESTLKLDLSTISTDFSSTFSPEVNDTSSKDSSETFDWIETRIQNLTDALDKLKAKADDTYSSWSARNSNLQSAIAKTQEAINLQAQAYNAYMAQANSVGLSETYKSLVRNGALNISTITDDKLADKINEYQSWYEKAKDCLDTQQDLQDSLNELNSQKFENLQSQYDAMIESLEKQKELIEGQITLLSSSSDYNQLRNQQRAIISNLQAERNVLNSTLNSLNITRGSEEWNNLASQITDIDQSIQDAYNNLKDIDNLQFDNLKEAFDFNTEKLDHSLQLMQDQIDLLEMKGLFANEKYYNSMISYTQQKIDNLQKEKEQLQSILNSTAYQQGTSEWNDMFSSLMEIDEELSSLNNDLTEFNNTIRDLNWEVFEYLEESLNRITDETDYLVELLSKEDLFNKENGNLTEYGTASIGLHAAAYDVYKQQAQDYYEEVQALQKQLVDGAGKDVLEQYYEMVDAHQDAILAAQDEKEAILDLIEQGYNAQLDALTELIEKRKKALSAEKSLYDYQKSIKEQTKNIASLEKQQASLAGDDSEETMAKIQQIKLQLEEAKENLKETEYEQYLSDTETMLDQLAEDYETWMNERLDNSDALLSEIVGKVGEQGSQIMDTLTQVADKNGTMLSESIFTIFSTDSPFTSSLTNGLHDVSENTVGAVNNMNKNLSNAISGTTAAIDKLINHVANITNAIAKNTNAGSNTGSGGGGSSVGGGNSGYTPSYTPPTSNGSNGSNSGSNTSSSSNGNSGSSGIFEYQKDYYPKNRLNVEQSVVDRLKYRDYNSSFSARSRYWQRMGFSGAYTGSDSQNVKMLNWMKSHGYKKGTDYVPKSGYYATQENGLEMIEHDGVFLTPLSQGDKVFNAEATKRLYELANDPERMKQLISPSLPNINLGLNEIPSVRNTHRENSISFGDTNIAIAQANNIEDIVDGLTKSKRFEDMICYVINEKAMGRSTIGKNKFLRH